MRGTGGHAPRLLEVPEGSQVPGPVPVGIAPAEMPQTCRMGRGREGLRAGGGAGGRGRGRPPPVPWGTAGSGTATLCRKGVSRRAA